jgi:hypothetical protein
VEEVCGGEHEGSQDAVALYQFIVHLPVLNGIFSDAEATGSARALIEKDIIVPIQVRNARISCDAMQTWC